jgi:hypothetical protein
MMNRTSKEPKLTSRFPESRFLEMARQIYVQRFPKNNTDTGEFQITGSPRSRRGKRQPKKERPQTP